MKAVTAKKGLFFIPLNYKFSDDPLTPEIINAIVNANLWLFIQLKFSREPDIKTSANRWYNTGTGILVCTTGKVRSTGHTRFLNFLKGAQADLMARELTMAHTDKPEYDILNTRYFRS